MTEYDFDLPTHDTADFNRTRLLLEAGAGSGSGSLEILSLVWLAKDRLFRIALLAFVFTGAFVRGEKFFEEG